MRSGVAASLLSAAAVLLLLHLSLKHAYTATISPNEVTTPRPLHNTTTRPLVTFIIPTKGRDTLHRTLSSLAAQSKPAWRAVVVCDGVDVAVVDDSRVTVMKIPRTGSNNHAALLRNFGMMHAQTEWLAFLDDDDTLAPTYVQHLEEELALTPALDCVIFRMLNRPGEVLPPPDAANFAATAVGISFAVKRQLFLEGFMFIPGSTEDYHLLNSLREHGKKMVISTHTTYFVKAPPAPDDWVNKSGRAVIN